LHKAFTFWFTLIAAITVLIATIVVVTVIVYSEPKITLAEHLDGEANQLFVPGAPRQSVEVWAKSQPGETGTFRKYDGQIGRDRVVSLAGLDAADVGYTIRIDYKDQESHWPDHYIVQLYFFFDLDDQLIKHWISEQITSF